MSRWLSINILNMLSLHMVTGLAKESTPTRLNGDTGRQSRKVVPEKKEQPESCGGRKRRKPKTLSLEKEMTTTLVFLSGKSHWQRTLWAIVQPQGCKDSDTTQHTQTPCCRGGWEGRQAGRQGLSLLCSGSKRLAWGSLRSLDVSDFCPNSELCCGLQQQGPCWGQGQTAGSLSCWETEEVHSLRRSGEHLRQGSFIFLEAASIQHQTKYTVWGEKKKWPSRQV